MYLHFFLFNCAATTVLYTLSYTLSLPEPLPILVSPTFGKHFAVELDDVTHRLLYIPPGFAHGFAVLSEVADFVYKCTDYYHPESEAGIRWDDPRLAVPWPAEIKSRLQISQKDSQLPLLDEQRPEIGRAHV